MTAMGPNLSKFRLAQLALRAAIELERKGAGGIINGDHIRQLSVALLQTSGTDDTGAPFRFVEPGFYQPLQRLYHDQESVRASDVELIQSLLHRVSAALAGAADGNGENTEALIRFCVALHQELIEELATEDALVVHEGRNYGHGAAASVSAA